MSKSIDYSSRRLRKQQTRAAWRVFLRRPLAICVLLPLLVMLVTLTLTPVLRLSDDGRLWSHVPSYTRQGKTLSKTNDIRRYLESGSTDASIVGLDLRLSYSLEKAGRLALQFPNVRWIRLTGLQFRNTSPDVFEGLQKLNSIEIQAPDIELRDLETLSQIASLKHVKLTGRRWDGDLSVLKKLPHLTSVHLVAYGTSDKAPLSSKRHVRELAQISTLREISLESPTVLTDTVLQDDNGKLTAAESQAVADFAGALSTATQLRTLYVGAQDTGAARQALRELRLALPSVSVRPASHVDEFWGKLFLFLVCSMFGMVMAALHFVSCCTLPQTCLVPGSQAAHGRVASYVILILLAVQLSFLVVVGNANVLAATAVCAAWVSMALATVHFGFLPRADAAAVSRDALACGATIGTFVATMFLGLAFVDRVEWFMFGEQPGIAAAITIVSAVLIYCSLKPLQVHRRWAENGIAPAAAMQPFILNFGALNQDLQRGPCAELHPAGWQDPWQRRLEKLTASMRLGDKSLIGRLRFWSMASWPQSLKSALLGTAILFLPLLTALMLLAGYLSEGVLAWPSLMETADMMGMMLPTVVLAVGANLYGRRPLFANELLMPVSRNTWRENALLSTLALTVIGSCWVWLIMYAIRLAISGSPEPMWMLYSLLATLAFGVLGAGMAAWIVMVRRVVFSVCCAGLIITAVIPFVATLTDGKKYSGLVVSTMHVPDFWLGIVGMELLIGLVVFGTAWRQWTKFELAG